MSTKQRLDQLLVNHHGISSLEIAQSLIMTGQVLVGNNKVMKSGTLIDPKLPIRLLKSLSRYVSRGAEKLQGAHKTFGLTLEDAVVLDIGISTGGFTDYCLQNGAKTVFGIDVGYGQVAMKIQQNPRVAIAERVNARSLTYETLFELINRHRPELCSDIEKISLVVMDLSFISCIQVLPAIKSLVSPNTTFCILVKPQFESNRHEINEGGIVRDPIIREQILERVKSQLLDLGFKIHASMESPLQGAKGNYEYFLWLSS
jgi:23S rRNA (cytidine1920-2'-O)/16S rRNA (cytidine1409-2'-O)-methyltransferase